MSAAVVIGLAMPVGVAGAESPTSVEALATEPVAVPGGTGAGNQTDPHLDGGLLVFTASDSSSSEIRYLDLADGSAGAIPDAGHRDSLPDVSGDLIVFRRIYTDANSATRPILVFDVTTPDAGAQEVAPASGERRTFPSIGGTTVAFMQFVDSSSVHTEVCVADVTDLAAPAVCLTSDSTMFNRDPAVSPDGSTVTWAKCDPTGTGCDIYVVQRRADGTWGVPVQLTDSTGEEFLPDTDGTVVTYASNAAGDFDVWFENVDGTSERQLVLPDAPGSIETHPNISGGSILFERELPGSTNADLYLYRTATRELLRVTETAEDETLNAISLSPSGELYVAWAQSDGLAFGDNDIHAARAQLDDGSSEPPALTLPADITVDATGPDGAAVTYVVTGSEGATVTCVPASGTTFPIGTTSVQCTAVDGHGATAAGAFGVTVRGAREQLADLLVAVAGLGPGRSLEAKIRAAVAWLPDRALPLACEPLRAFVNEVRAQSGKRIPADLAAEFIADATRIRAVLACR
ncbi:hypothetical protein GCM10010531_42730 [Blastococcus jejuensis]|uniref:WD40-like Beta Propeller Repeat n=1 Tax=Blastococcus jejuensis TaxID=351224 RepID=A0ABP6PNU6_9ACTN